MATASSFVAPKIFPRTVAAAVKSNGEGTLTVNYTQEDGVIHTSSYTFSLLLREEGQNREEDITASCTEGTSRRRLIQIAETITSFVLDRIHNQPMTGADIDLSGLEITDLTEEAALPEKEIYAHGQVHHGNNNPLDTSVEGDFLLKEGKLLPKESVSPSETIPLSPLQPSPHFAEPPPTSAMGPPSTISPFQTQRTAFQSTTPTSPTSLIDTQSPPIITPFQANNSSNPVTQSPAEKSLPPPTPVTTVPQSPNNPQTISLLPGGNQDLQAPPITLPSANNPSKPVTQNPVEKSPLLPPTVTVVPQSPNNPHMIPPLQGGDKDLPAPHPIRLSQCCENQA